MKRHMYIGACFAAMALVPVVGCTSGEPARSEPVAPSEPAARLETSGSQGECFECQRHNCRDFLGFDWVAGCYEDTEIASEGPAAGTPKNELCVNYLECAAGRPAEVGGPSCGAEIESDSTLCYCGPGFSEDPASCLLPGAAAGPCMADAAAAAESTDAPTVAERWVNPAYAIGNANNLLRCIAATGCTDVCYP